MSSINEDPEQKRGDAFVAASSFRVSESLTLVKNPYVKAATVVAVVVVVNQQEEPPVGRRRNCLLAADQEGLSNLAIWQSYEADQSPNTGACDRIRACNRPKPHTTSVW